MDENDYLKYIEERKIEKILNRRIPKGKIEIPQGIDFEKNGKKYVIELTTEDSEWFSNIIQQFFEGKINREQRNKLTKEKCEELSKHRRVTSKKAFQARQRQLEQKKLALEHVWHYKHDTS